MQVSCIYWLLKYFAFMDYKRFCYLFHFKCRINKVWNGTTCCFVSILYIITSVNFQDWDFKKLLCYWIKNEVISDRSNCYLHYTGQCDITVHRGLQKSWLQNQWWCWFWCNPASPASRIVSEIHPERQSCIHGIVNVN